MRKKEELLNIVNRNGGYITTRDLTKYNINRRFLALLVKEEKLVRVSRGYYTLPNTFSDDFYIILSKCKKAVFSDATALYLHNLSDRTPLIYDVTLPYGYGNCYKDMPNVCLHYVKNANINLGMIEIESPFGMKIKTYDIERTICDIIKNKNKMDIEIFVKALKEYSRLKNKDLNKLMRYAKKSNVEKKVREYMEVLL